MKGDKQLQQEVTEALISDPAIHGSEIGVQVRDGVVTLTGHLATFAEKFSAEAAVRRVCGVRAMATELDVHLPDDTRPTDADVARAAANVLSWDASVPFKRIRILVEHGVVTLSGDVDWHYQRVAAEHAVAGLHGVTGVTNALVVRPRAQGHDVVARIGAAMARQAIADAEQVRVAVKDGSVTLSGTLRTLAEREAAVAAAWSAPGVHSVIDKIEVVTG